MRELERQEPHATRPRCAIIGAGRLGRALAVALRAAGHPVGEPLGRGADGGDAEVVILCVPDEAIVPVAARVRPGRLVGHCSGATGLDALSPHEAFGLHPLMTVSDSGATFAGAGCAVDGTSERALEVATAIARDLGMVPVRVAAADRAAYHAAASMASNYLVTLEAAAERLAATAGIDRALLAPLVHATVSNWISLGGARAITGPVARGDEDTVRRQRAAIAERAPDLLELFDSLADATRRLARNGGPPPARDRRPPG